MSRRGPTRGSMRLAGAAGGTETPHVPRGRAGAGRVRGAGHYGEGGPGDGLGRQTHLVPGYNRTPLPDPPPPRTMTSANSNSQRPWSTC